MSLMSFNKFELGFWGFGVLGFWGPRRVVAIADVELHGDPCCLRTMGAAQAGADAVVQLVHEAQCFGQRTCTIDGASPGSRGDCGERKFLDCGRR